MWRALLVLGAGFSTTALFVAYLLNAMRHTVRIEGFATKLSKANEDFGSEMAERKRAETELESVNSGLESIVAERVKQLGQSNQRLRSEILERAKVEASLRESTTELESALAQLRETQQQIIQQERMRAMGQMASGIANDFNNALAPIVSYTGLLLKSPDRLDDKERATRYLRTMTTAALDAAEVVKRLREFYRDPGERVLKEVKLDSLVKTRFEEVPAI